MSEELAEAVQIQGYVESDEYEEHDHLQVQIGNLVQDHLLDPIEDDLVQEQDLVQDHVLNHINDLVQQNIEDSSQEQEQDEVADGLQIEVHEQEQVFQEQSQQKIDHESNAGIGDGEKRWPGWPGESVFRMLVPAQKVGSIIGRKGEFIKKIVVDSKARVKILDGPQGTTERAVMVSAKEEPDSSLPPAIDGLLRVHRRLLDGLEGDTFVPSGKISTRLLLPASQAGNLIGKQGATVKSIQEGSNCVVRVLGSEELPVFALQDDRVVEVIGDAENVHKGVELIAFHLRKFLVDRSVVQLFEMQMQMPNPQSDHMPPPHQSWGPPHGHPPNAPGGPGYGLGPNPSYMPPPRQVDKYYPAVDNYPPMEKQPHQGISAYGRDAPMSVQSTAPSASSMITQQVTQQMQIPLSYADAVIGTAGASISYIRRVSGSTVTVQESRGAPGEMTVEISGTASQVQTAQQLIQNFMAEAGAPPPTLMGGSTDQGYNPYGSSYTSPSSNPGYGSLYSSSYGY